MIYRVTFGCPVILHADHPLRRRTITELLVHAPSEAQAQIHAVRVTLGDPGDLRVEAAPTAIWDQQQAIRATMPETP